MESDQEKRVEVKMRWSVRSLSGFDEEATNRTSDVGNAPTRNENGVGLVGPKDIQLLWNKESVC